MEGIDWNALEKAEQKAKTTEVIHVTGEKKSTSRSERVKTEQELRAAVRNTKESNLSLRSVSLPTPLRDQELQNQVIHSDIDRDTICVILNQYKKIK
jgi:hypothetical protein